MPSPTGAAADEDVTVSAKNSSMLAAQQKKQFSLFFIFI
jgi:hypothetical protein